MRHVPVLQTEVLQTLTLRPGARVIDATLGDGGHAQAILERTAPTGTLLGLDADPVSLARARQNLAAYKRRIVPVRDTFANLLKVAGEHGFTSVDAILFDLGWSLPQVKERGRGFSFLSDEPLDMRYDPTAGETAAELLARSTEEEIASILRRYGEEPRAGLIARALYAARPVRTSAQAAAAVLQVYRGALRSKTHPATRTFQALRIWTNDELTALKNALPAAVGLLSTGGRLAVISFHSLEDRIVKQFFNSCAELTVITKRPITAGKDEVARNAASRSAKLRAAQKK